FSHLLSLLSHSPPLSPTLFPYTTLFRSQFCNNRYTHSTALGKLIEIHSTGSHSSEVSWQCVASLHCLEGMAAARRQPPLPGVRRSEEHTSELQSRFDLVCRLLLEKKKYI